MNLSPRTRHLTAFLFCGLLATGTDILVYQLLNSAFAVPPPISRLFSVGLAMVVGWLAHRRFTFAIKSPPVLREFIVYAGVAWIAVSVNYVCFLLILYLLPDLPGSIAIIFSSAVAMVVSYLGMRFGVFRNAS